MIKQAFFLLTCFYLFTSIYKLSEENQGFLIPIVDFINLLSAYVNIRNFVVFNYGTFDRKKFLGVAMFYIIGSIIYRRMILRHDYNPISWIAALKHHYIILLGVILAPNIGPLQQKLIFTIAGLSSAISYHSMLKGVATMPPITALLPLIFNLNLSGFFSKFSMWIADFSLFGKVYPDDYLLHFILNVLLVPVAIVSNNMFSKGGHQTDFLWHYLVVYFLFLTNHGSTIFKKRYLVVKETKAGAEKQATAVAERKRTERRQRKEQKSKAR